ncbi:hypothetical protein JG687_00018285 [Phytophthora cactorum]|nr:hypothetical protein GQ600_14659 [Phytophthora cactorum]KAG4250347.1 hypothetical protein PC116_g1979 [Phytophthora cactorum]KAG6943712.1 hypothetical protein JG687_00018285 [Phytophthora cactorum]
MLSTENGQRFFKAIHVSPNKTLYRGHFRIGVQAFDAISELCPPHIRRFLEHHDEVLAVALNWMGDMSAPCRAQEVLFGMAYSTVLKYRPHSVYAIV